MYADVLYLEVLRDVLILFPRERHTFDAGMLLPFERDDRLIKNDTLVFLSVHHHQALHEVLLNHQLSAQTSYK